MKMDNRRSENEIVSLHSQRFSVQRLISGESYFRKIICHHGCSYNKEEKNKISKNCTYSQQVYWNEHGVGQLHQLRRDKCISN